MSATALPLRRRHRWRCRRSTKPALRHHAEPPSLPPPYRGAVERVCHRWRQLALQLPASLSIDLCGLCGAGFGLAERDVTAGLERLLPHLKCRRIASLSITGCSCALAATTPARLARVLYPQLRRWVLGGRIAWVGGGCHW